MTSRRELRAGKRLFSCREQIAQGAGRPTAHPAEALALGLEP